MAIGQRTFDSPVDLVREANSIGGRHGLGMADQIAESDQRGERVAGATRLREWLCCLLRTKDW